MAKRTLLLSLGLPLLGVSALLMGTILVAQNQPINTVEKPTVTPPVSPLSAGLSTAKSAIGAIGVLEASTENHDISPFRSGVVTAVYVQAGDAVSKGQPLFELDSRAAIATHNQRQQELAVAEATLEELIAEIPAAKARLSRAKADLAARKADLVSAEADLERESANLADRENQERMANSITVTGGISQEERDRRGFAAAQATASVAAVAAIAQSRESSVEAAEASIAEATANLELLEVQGVANGPQLRKQQAAIEQAKAGVQASQTEIDYLTINSPINGTALQVNVDSGEFATAGSLSTPLIVLGVLDPLYVRVQIDEIDIPRFSKTASAWGTARGAASNRVPLTFVRVEPLVIAKRNLTGRTSELIDTRVYEVIYKVEPNEQSLWPGQQMDVYIEAGERAS
ncbi:MAG: HlyD family secretion protein [Sumerlaeia bacterium]